MNFKRIVSHIFVLKIIFISLILRANICRHFLPQIKREFCFKSNVLPVCGLIYKKKKTFDVSWNVLDFLMKI